MDWNLHYMRVLIGDGQPELRVGDVFLWFAIEFWTNFALIPSLERTKTATPIAGNCYRVNAEVIYISHDPGQDACILDFGIRTVSELGGLLGIPLPFGCQVGDYVTGEIQLNIPLCTALHPFALSHRWRVNQVSACLTDFRCYPDDLSEVHYQDVPGTDSLPTEMYILHCSCLDP